MSPWVNEVTEVHRFFFLFDAQKCLNELTKSDQNFEIKWKMCNLMKNWFLSLKIKL